MVAYFALLSFVPLLFLALSLVGLTGQPTESSYLITELRRAFPSSSLDALIRVVRETQKNAAELGIIGAIGLLWGSLGFFSVLESAFNIVYGLPNRSFVHQKTRVALLIALQAYGGLVLLLFWLYLMANVLVFGAEVNWWLANGREKPVEEPTGLA